MEFLLYLKGALRKQTAVVWTVLLGIGDEKALKILQKVGAEFEVPTVTDIHEADDAVKAAEFVDVLQIPAFLVRQTDLIVAAAKTGKYINLKKRTVYES